MAATDHDVVAGVLARAFHADPMMVHLMPSASRRKRALPVYFHAVLDLAAARGVRLVCERDGRIEGAVLAMPPGAYPFTLGSQLRQRRAIRASGLAATVRNFRDLGPIDEARPKVPYWYVMFVGVEPSHQRSGAGRALLTSVLARADLEQLPTYLVTMAPDNVAYYAALGFTVVEEMRMGRRGPRTRRMLRTVSC